MSTPKVKRNKGDEPTREGSGKAVKDSDTETPRPPVDRSKKPKPKDSGADVASGNAKSPKTSKSKLNGAEKDAKDAARDSDDSDSDSSSDVPPPKSKKSAKPKPKESSSDSEESDEASSESAEDPKPVAKQPTKKPSAKLPSQPDSPATKRSASGRASSQTSLQGKKSAQPKKRKDDTDEDSDSSDSSDRDDSAIVESEDDRDDVATKEDLLDPDSSESAEEKPKPKQHKKLASSSTNTTAATAASSSKDSSAGKRTKGSKEAGTSPRGSKPKGNEDGETTPTPKKKPIAVSTENAASGSSKRDKKHATPAPGDRDDESDSVPLPDSDAEEKKPEPKPDEAKKPAKSGGFFASIFGKKKNDSDKVAAPVRTEPRERKVIMVSSITDLSDDIQKKLKKAKIPEEKLQKNLRILLNVLHFLTKDSYRMPGEDKDPPRERRPYATASMIETAKATVIVPDNIKKYYRSIEFSGKGGFGRVFAAKDVATKRRVAIKRVPHVTEKDKRNNYCEIAFLSQCKHPNVVNYIKAWEVKDEAWIVTEFLEGGTLSEAVKVHQFSERHIAYVAREILKALKYLHSINFVHRDLKSGNVMMSIEGHIKLIDFGLCCEVGSGERTQMLGSPYWIPPEMIKRKPHGCAADIWSFAVCVLEMFLKEPPNASSRLYAMFIAAADGIQDAIPPKASPMAKDFLSKCLMVNPAKRATAEELLQHPFVTQPKLEEGIKDVLRGVFVSNSLALSGI